MGSANFVIDANGELLDLGLIGRNFSQKPSTLVGLSDPVAALDFDAAASMRLWLFDLVAEDRLAQKITTYVLASLSGQTAVGEKSTTPGAPEPLKW
jgi:hypothetical protein